MFGLAARQGVRLTLLDIGGGFPGWDGSEYMYQHHPMPHGEPGAGVGGEERGQVTTGESAPTNSAPSTTVQSALDVGAASAKDRGRDSGGGASGTTAAQADGAAAGGGGNDASTPPAPLSLGEIARVTVPVLDDLFPPGSGVQVKKKKSRRQG